MPKSIINFFKDFFRDMFRSQKNQKPDWYLIGTIGFLILFGLIALTSAGVAQGRQTFNDSYGYIKHQLLLGFLPGVFLFIILSRFDYFKLKKLALPLLLISIALLFLVFIPGIGNIGRYGTAKSWLNVFGFSIQPSEIVKLTFLLYLATWLSNKEEKHLRDLHYGFLPFIFILMVITALVIMQPDFGTMSIIVIMSLAVYFVAGGRLWHLSWLTALGASVVYLMIRINPRRADRLTTFLYPELDPQRIGYHINQALLAVGSGGWFGKGYGHSIQKFAYLPETTGDSIFAVSAEELGFIISALIVAAFAFLALRGFKLAQNCRDPFAKLLVVGIITWFVFQAFLNIGAIIGILPLTGVPLPFISYGGTALAMCLAAAGILANISRTVPRD